MKCVVTGAAGFIGSHLSNFLLAKGHEVVGVDCFTSYYDRSIKEENVARLKGSNGFRLVEEDLNAVNLDRLLDGVDVVFHLAGQPGVRASWGRSFSEYIQCNVSATQRLLEACKSLKLRRFVYASSSSVYGQPDLYPLTEDLPCRPISPYGVTKLAGEHLCVLYHRHFDVPAVSLRYFTVYGPGQRPDMAFHRMIRAALADQPFPLYGDGRQTRDFTFVSDAVEATYAAVEAPGGEVINVGGGSRVTMLDVISVLESILGKKVRTEMQEGQKGDVMHTWADLGKASEFLSYKPKVDLKTGLAEEVNWLKNL